VDLAGRAQHVSLPEAVGVSGRRRLKDLWSVLNSQMGALMRAEIERRGIGLTDDDARHLPLLEAVRSGDLARLRQEIHDHYLTGFPPDAQVQPDSD
jgi:DNA-binding GntR family transcriptional regulator